MIDISDKEEISARYFVLCLTVLGTSVLIYMGYSNPEQLAKLAQLIVWGAVIGAVLIPGILSIGGLVAIWRRRARKGG